jgi:hypothetical protein
LLLNWLKSSQQQAAAGVAAFDFQEWRVRTHRFAVGQSVRFVSGVVGRPGAAGNYKVVRVLPSDGDEQLYRIKSASEPHERVARESQLDSAV